MVDFFLAHFRYAKEAFGPYVPLWSAGDEDTSAVRHHRRILRWGAVTGAINSLAWSALILFGMLNDDLKDAEDWLLLAMVPGLAIAAFLAGTFLGVALVCAFSPKWFLLGPGEPWVKLIGTRNMIGARLVCLAVAAGMSLFVAIPITAIAALIIHA